IIISFPDVDSDDNSSLHIAVTNGQAINAEILLRRQKKKKQNRMMHMIR
ncbi:unnamed protein product, partial [Rotaria sp. Silwood2]